MVTCQCPEPHPKLRTGRVVVEVFIDMVPLAARTFVNRCRPGSTGSFQGTSVHRALRGLAVYTGLSNKCAA